MTDGRLKAAFIVSRAITGTKISKEVTTVLKDYGLPVLNAYIAQRVIYPVTAASGSTVLNSESNNDSALEIIAMANEINNYLIEFLSK